MDDTKRNMQIKRVTLADQACEQLKAYISAEHLIVGDKLPSEAELAEMLGVNRFTVRMALQKLSTLGLIETRVGEGSFIKDFSITSYLNELSDFYVSDANMAEVFTLRKMIELECLKLLISKGSDEDIAEVRKAYDKYHDLRFENSAAATESGRHSDLKFHYAICYYSHNTLLSQLFALLSPIVDKYIKKIASDRIQARDENRLEDDHDYHIDVMEAIEARDWKACKTAYLKTIGVTEYPTIPSDMED